MENKYRVVNGTSYRKETPIEVVQILESSRQTGRQLRIHYGDVETGRDWMDEHAVTGHIGRSTGEVKIPLMIANKRSTGGGGILDACIVRIRATGNTELYRHPKYHQPIVTLVHDPEGAVTQTEKMHGREPIWYPYAIVENGKVYARFMTAKQRSNWFKKMGMKEPLNA